LRRLYGAEAECYLRRVVLRDRQWRNATHATLAPPRSCARGLKRSRCSRPGRPRLA